MVGIAVSGHHGLMRAVKKTAPEASTGPVGAWISGDRWFLTERGDGAGKLGCGRTRQRGWDGEGGDAAHQWRQGNRVAGLAGGAGFTMPGGFLAQGVVSLSRCVPCAIGRTRRLMRQRLCRWPCRLMVKMAFGPCLISRGSYYFSSKRNLLQMAHRHASGHRVAHPAAQKQQEDHGNEQGTAHG